MIGVRVPDCFRRRPDAERMLIELRPVDQPSLRGCVHRYRTWGLDPGTVTCSCGARWRAKILR